MVRLKFMCLLRIMLIQGRTEWGIMFVAVFDIWLQLLEISLLCRMKCGISFIYSYKMA